MNQIYKPKSLNKEETYRNFISIYYYLLFNEKPENYYKKIIKYFHKEKTKLFQEFFYKYFLLTQNVFFFTLYNQLPIEFLPLPQYVYYFNYPLITFVKNFNNYYNYFSIKLNNSYINHNESFDIDLYWEKMTMSEIKKEEIKKIKETIPEIKNNESNDKYDNFQICFNMDYLMLLSDDYLFHKIIFLFTDKPIILENYKFIKKKKIFIVYKCYIKNKNGTYQTSSTKIIIHLNQINFLSIYSKLYAKDILQCFDTVVLPKNTYLYNQANTKLNIEKFKNVIPWWFTLTPFSRIHDPLYLLPNEKYIYREYITNNDINILNISTNIYLNNVLYNKNHSKTKDLFYCLNNYIKLKYYDYDFVDGDKLNTQFNYNKKSALLLIIWKNKKFIDNKISFGNFLKKLKIDNFFNMLSVIKLNDNKIKLLSDELNIKNGDILEVNNYTTDITQLHLYDQKDKYENIYYKQ